MKKSIQSKYLLLLSLAQVGALAAAAPADPASGAAGTPAAAQQAPAFKSHVLTKTEIDALLTTPDQVLFIDVRRPDELTAIGGFPVYLSIQIKDLESSLAYIPRDRKLVLVSNHAARAGKAADLLTAKGFNVVGAAGAQTYEADGGKLIHIAAPAPKQVSAAQ